MEGQTIVYEAPDMASLSPGRGAFSFIGTSDKQLYNQIVRELTSNKLNWIALETIYFIQCWHKVFIILLDNLYYFPIK